MRVYIAATALFLGVIGASLAQTTPEAEIRSQVAKCNGNLKDIRATLVVTQADRRELEKMGKVFAETYQFKKASVAFKSPDKLRMNGTLGVMKVEFITAGNTRRIRIPSMRFKKLEDITEEQEKRMSSLDIGVVTTPVWDIYKVNLLRTENNADGSQCSVLRLQTAKTQKFRHIWIESGTGKLLRLDRYFEDGQLKVKTVFSNHEQFEGVWIPTRAEVYNAEGKLAAVSEMVDITVNTGIDDKEFE